MEIWFGKFIKLEKLISKKKISKNDYKISANLRFKYADVNIFPVEKKETCHLKISLKNLTINYLEDGDRIKIITNNLKNNKLKNEKNMITKTNLSQYNVYKEIVNFTRNKKFNLCSDLEAFRNLKLMNKIIKS